MRSERNLAISSSILRISLSKRSRMLENSVSMTLKSPILIGIFLLLALSAIFLSFEKRIPFVKRCDLNYWSGELFTCDINHFYLIKTIKTDCFNYIIEFSEDFLKSVLRIEHCVFFFAICIAVLTVWLLTEYCGRRNAISFKYTDWIGMRDASSHARVSRITKTIPQQPGARCDIQTFHVVAACVLLP